MIWHIILVLHLLFALLRIWLSLHSSALMCTTAVPEHIVKNAFTSFLFSLSSHTETFSISDSFLSQDLHLRPQRWALLQNTQYREPRTTKETEFLAFFSVNHLMWHSLSNDNKRCLVQGNILCGDRFFWLKTLWTRSNFWLKLWKVKRLKESWQRPSNVSDCVETLTVSIDSKSDNARISLPRILDPKQCLASLLSNRWLEWLGMLWSSFSEILATTSSWNAHHHLLDYSSCWQYSSIHDQLERLQELE